MPAKTPSTFKRKLALLLLKLWGWTPVGEDPGHSAVITAGPHTSNLDYLLMMFTAWSRGMELSWMGKRELFDTPVLGKLLKATGGISVDRSAPQGLVEQMAEEFRKNDHLYLAIPPEGTRSYTEYWKSGFYRIAQQADVPIVMCSVDKATKTVDIGPTVYLTGEITSDMDVFREYYGSKTGLKHELFGPIRLREEDETNKADEANSADANQADETGGEGASAS